MFGDRRDGIGKFDLIRGVWVNAGETVTVIAISPLCVLFFGPIELRSMLFLVPNVVK